jgi:fructose/tagatose bisphosphate aldolase
VLARGTEILAKAVAEHSAVPAFATYNLEMVQAVVAAAEQTGRPVIMLAGSSHFNHPGRSALMLDTHDSVALWSAGREAATTAAVRSIYMLAGSHRRVANTS